MKPNTIKQYIFLWIIVMLGIQGVVAAEETGVYISGPTTVSALSTSNFRLENWFDNQIIETEWSVVYNNTQESAGEITRNERGEVEITWKNSPDTEIATITAKVTDSRDITYLAPSFSVTINSGSGIRISGDTVVSLSEISNYKLENYVDNDIVDVAWSVLYENSQESSGEITPVANDAVEIVWNTSVDTKTAIISARVTDSNNSTYWVKPLTVTVNVIPSYSNVYVSGPTTVIASDLSNYKLENYADNRVVDVLWDVSYEDTQESAGGAIPIYEDIAEIRWEQLLDTKMVVIRAQVTDGNGAQYWVEPFMVTVNPAPSDVIFYVSGQTSVNTSGVNNYMIEKYFGDQEILDVEWSVLYNDTQESAGEISPFSQDGVAITWKNSSDTQTAIIRARVTGANNNISWARPITVTINAIPTFSNVYISGPSRVDASGVNHYEIKNYFDNQIVEAEWSVSYDNDQDSPGEITHVYEYDDLVDIAWKHSLDPRTARIRAKVTDTNRNTYWVERPVIINPTPPIFFLKYTANPLLNTTNEMNLRANVPGFTTEWSVTGSNTIESFTEDQVQILWNRLGEHIVTARITYRGEVYIATRKIIVQEPFHFPPFIIGKTAVKLTTDTKYDLKIEEEGTVLITWGISGGQIIEQDDMGVVVQWSNSNGGTLSASVDFADGGTPVTTDLEVQIAPEQVSPYNSTISSNENFIKTSVYQEATQEAFGIHELNTKKIESITYYDALGRPKQSVALQAGGAKQNIITHIEYDAFGRQAKEFLPYASVAIGTSFRTEAAQETSDFYDTEKYEHTANPFTEDHYDGSPLNRDVKQAAPGNDWDANVLEEHTQRKQYDVYKNSDAVLKLGVVYNQGDIPTLQVDGLYEVGRISNGEKRIAVLRKFVVKNENWTLADGINNTSEEFVDYQGRTILKRAFDQSIAHETYYVYDEFENLVFVIPPKVTIDDGVSDDELTELCYQYRYDHRNLVISKKIPGKDWKYIVYDRNHRPILVQDALQRAQNKWLFTKYDRFGRVIYTGVYTTTQTQAELQEAANGFRVCYENKQDDALAIQQTDLYYSATASFPDDRTKMELLTINYYDNYTFDTNGITAPATVFDQAITANTKGLPTGRKVKVLGTNDWITTVNYYDDEARAVYTSSKNRYLNTTDIVSSKLEDFTGIVLKTKSRHQKGTSAEIVTLDTFTYDHMNRLLTHKQCIGDDDLDNSCGDSTIAANSVENVVLDQSNFNILGLPRAIFDIKASNSILLLPGFEYKAEEPGFFKASLDDDTATLDASELIVANIYNELGVLETKQIGNKENKPLQQVDFTYNVRGLITGVNDVDQMGDDLFAFKVNYNNPTHNATALYNGNISETEWKTANDNTERWYAYRYDDLDRITAAIDNTNNYSVPNITYDKNGNITFLERMGAINDAATSFDMMDDLNYTYDAGNKLLSVHDEENENHGFKDGNTSGDDYEYDINGNMTIDRNKGISAITYNHMNLPESISISNNQGTGTITYIYDATGRKLKKIANEGNSLTETEYASGYVYKNGELKFFNHSEGYIEPDGFGGYDYVYQYKDHLGNIRLSYSDKDKDGIIDIEKNDQDADGDGDYAMEIREEKNYYPFGLQHKGYNDLVTGRKHNYGYNGKEENHVLGLGTLAFGARNYDPSIGRFFVLDRLSEDFSFQSPYVYGANNPVIFIDENGDGPILGGIGLLVGGLVEAGTQVAASMATGKSFGDAIDDIDYADVAISAVEWGVAGLTNGASLAVSGKIVDVAQASVDMKKDLKVETVLGGLNGGEKKSLGVAAAEFVAGQVGGAIFEIGGKAVQKQVAKTTSKMVKKTASASVAAAKNLTKSNNVAKHGASNSKAALPYQAFNNFSVAKDKAITAKAVDKAVNSTAAEAVVKTTDDIVSQMAKNEAADRIREEQKKSDEDRAWY